MNLTPIAKVGVFVCRGPAQRSEGRENRMEERIAKSLERIAEMLERIAVEENEQTQQLRIIAAKTGMSLSPRSRRP